MEKMKSKKINIKNEAQDSNRDKITEIVQEKLGDILNESGISPGKNIGIEAVSGEDADPVFHIQSQNSAYALKIFSAATNQAPPLRKGEKSIYSKLSKYLLKTE